IGLGSANKLKFAKIILIQKIKTIKNGIGIGLSPCVYSSKRVRAMLAVTSVARFLRERCSSVCGDSWWSFTMNPSPAAVALKGAFFERAEPFSGHVRPATVSTVHSTRLRIGVGAV